jgi:hypothetical protein
MMTGVEGARGFSNEEVLVELVDAEDRGGSAKKF